MAITMKTPTQIYLGGPGYQLIDDLAASAAVTPGYLIERHNDSGVLKWRAHATAGGAGAAAFALDRSEVNKGITDAYAAGDIVKAAIAAPGDVFYAILPSGQNITQGALLESAGNGTLRVLNSGEAIAQALETVNNSAGPSTARIRVEAL